MSLQCWTATEVAPALQPLHLIEEITHRVVNEYTEAICSLALAAKSANAATRTALTMAADRLRAQVEGHRALQAPFTNELTDLSNYVARVCACLSRAPLSENGVQLTVDTEEIWLDAGRCWRVGLIVAELVRNAAKHGLRGGPGSVRVAVAEASGLIICQVSDEGRGPDELRHGRGRQLVCALAAELGGTVFWTFSPIGCLARVEFPMQLPNQSELTCLRSVLGDER